MSERDLHDPCSDCDGPCAGCAYREAEDEEPPICGACNGSGEGMYDGTRCTHCGGSGVERSKA